MEVRFFLENPADIRRGTKHVPRSGISKSFQRFVNIDEWASYLLVKASLGPKENPKSFQKSQGGILITSTRQPHKQVDVYDDIIWKLYRPQTCKRLYSRCTEHTERAIKFIGFNLAYFDYEREARFLRKCRIWKNEAQMQRNLLEGNKDENIYHPESDQKRRIRGRCRVWSKTHGSTNRSNYTA